jgi:hypothetical protein
MEALLQFLARVSARSTFGDHVRIEFRNIAGR